jgi:hypothetical protein
MEWASVLLRRRDTSDNEGRSGTSAVGLRPPAGWGPPNALALRLATDVVEGAGRAFCAGYDLGEYAEGRDLEGQPDHPCRQEKKPWDSGRPIPEGDEARALVAEHEARLAQARAASAREQC